MKKLVIIVSLFLCASVAYSQTAKEYYVKGYDYGEAGKYEEAIIYFTKALELNNEYVDI